MSWPRSDFVEARWCDVVVEDCTKWNKDLPSDVISSLESKETRSRLKYDSEKLLSIVGNKFGEYCKTFIKIGTCSPFRAEVMDVIFPKDHKESKDGVVYEDEVQQYSCFNWQGCWVYEYISEDDREDSNGVDWKCSWRFFSVVK